MVANGQGVAIASDMLYRPWSLEGKRVETIALADPIQPLSIGMAWRADEAVAPEILMIQEYFRKLYSDPPIRNNSVRR
jgi:DNA-binding transcriptional LysR family regulator